jgi:hypothetical protein
MKPIVAYYRVSPQKQARSGKKGWALGLKLSARRWSARARPKPSHLVMAAPQRRHWRVSFIADAFVRLLGYHAWWFSGVTIAPIIIEHAMQASPKIRSDQSPCVIVSADQRQSSRDIF